METLLQKKVQGIRFLFLGSSSSKQKDEGCDLRSLDQTRAIFAKHRPTYVIHLAARVGGLFANMQDKVGFYEDNMCINMNVVKCCFEFKVKRLISALSTCIFPDKIPGEF